MAAIRACVFDLGNVLVGFSHARMWRQLGAATGLDPADAKSVFAAEERFRRYERGELSDAQALDLLEARAGRAFDRTAALHAFSDIFAPIPGMAALVRRVRATGRKVGLLSNTVGPHIQHLRATLPELFADFDALTLSYEARVLKPESASYAAALAALGVPAAAAWFVDDLPENIAGARAAGLRATLFTGREALEAEFHAAGLFDPLA